MALGPIEPAIEGLAGHLAALAASAEAWWRHAAENTLGEPMHLALLALSLLAGIVSGKLTVLVAAGIWATFGASMIDAQSPATAPFIASLLIAAQVILLIAVVTERRTRRRLVRHAASLERDRGEIQTRLDREVQWRRAAEPAAAPRPAPAG